MKRYLHVIYSDGYELFGPYQEEKDRFEKATKIDNDLNEELVDIFWINVHEDLSIKMGCYIYEDLK
jgi:hypothetical protein